jgi:hypothetical protein
LRVFRDVEDNDGVQNYPADDEQGGLEAGAEGQQGVRMFVRFVTNVFIH